MACLGWMDSIKTLLRERIGTEGKENIGKRRGQIHFFHFAILLWVFGAAAPLGTCGAFGFSFLPEVLKVALRANFLTNSLIRLLWVVGFSSLYYPEHGITFQTALVGRLVLRATRTWKHQELPVLLWRTLGMDLMEGWSVGLLYAKQCREVRTR